MRGGESLGTGRQGYLAVLQVHNRPELEKQLSGDLGDTWQLYLLALYGLHRVMAMAHYGWF